MANTTQPHSDDSPGHFLRQESPARRRLYRRRSIDLHPDLFEEMDRIQVQLRLRSHSEVIQKALQFLALIYDREGQKDVFVAKPGEKPQKVILI